MVNLDELYNYDNFLVIVFPPVFLDTLKSIILFGDTQLSPVFPSDELL
jgi:hypothetical protein